MSWIIITAIIIILALWWLINSTNTPKSGIKSSAEKISVQGPLKHIRSQKKRERLEDIIKDLYHEIAAGHEETKPIIDSLSQKLGVKVQKLNKDIDILREAGFVSSSSLELTSQGKEYALGLIRKHRLYERYLAEHSGYSPAEWHKVAHQMEHRVNLNELRVISEKLHNPQIDPHGDPIPSNENTNIEPENGLNIEELKPNEYLRILHLDDANAEILSKLAGIGLFPGALIRIISNNKDKGIDFLFQGETFNITKREAMSLTFIHPSVLPQSNMPDIYGAFLPDAVKRLTSLPKDKSAVICGIDVNCRGSARRRLLDLGFVRGSKVSIYLQSPLGNPNAYLIRGSGIALRYDQARHILIDPQSLNPL